MPEAKVYGPPAPRYRAGLHCLTKAQAGLLTAEEAIVDALTAARAGLLLVPPAQVTDEQARALALVRDALRALKGE
jgi:hypothetical protein